MSELIPNPHYADVAASEVRVSAEQWDINKLGSWWRWHWSNIPALSLVKHLIKAYKYFLLGLKMMNYICLVYAARKTMCTRH